MVLRHATGEAKANAWVASFVVDELPQAMQDAFFCMFANGTGIEKNHVGVVNSFRWLVAMRLEQADKQLSIGDIHLAAVGFNVDFAGIHKGSTEPLL
jgi:hypothetical protein